MCTGLDPHLLDDHKSARYMFIITDDIINQIFNYAHFNYVSETTKVHNHKTRWINLHNIFSSM